jgi:hypothetical protein
LISDEKEVDIHNRLNHSVKIAGIINNMFKPQNLLKKTRIKLYNTWVLPAVLYGSENWTFKARDTRRITAAEMNYMRKTAGHTWTDYKTNTEIAKEPHFWTKYRNTEEIGCNMSTKCPIIDYLEY